MTAISVIIPTYNRAALVQLAINSVLAQTHPAAEIIVVDDGSADNTREALEPYGDKIRLISQPNTGLSGARNTGIKAARNEWIAFLDDDDEYAPDRLRLAAEGISRFPSVVVHTTNTAIVSENGQELDLFKIRGLPATEWMEVQKPLLRVLSGCFFAQSLVVKRSVLEEVGLFRNTFYEDMDLFVRLVPKNPWIVDSRPSLRLIRRGNATAMSDDWRARPVKRCEALVRIHREAFQLPGLDATELIQVRTGLGTYLFDLGAAQLNQGDSRSARQCFGESAKVFTSPRSRIKALAAYCFGKPFLTLLKRLSGNKKGLVR